MADLNLNLMLSDKNIMYSKISKSKGGYYYASVYSKIKDGEYVNIDYEWSDEQIPEFVMGLVNSMTGPAKATASINTTELTEEARERLERQRDIINALLDKK